jgi:hypothetical protein
MIGRVARMNEELAIDRAADPLEQQEQLIEETARRVNESIDAQDALSGSYQALLLDLTA